MSGISHRACFTRVFTSAASLAAVCLATNAHALDLGVGLMGTAGGNFIPKPDRGPLDPDVNPGFGGVTVGGGLLLDARLLPFLGVELDVLRTSDKASGDLTVNGTKVNVTVGQGAWHVPVLLKVVLPSPLLAPYAVLGPEFVFPSSVDGEGTSSGVTVPVQQFVDKYTMVTFGLGLEVKLPLPILDLRIPVSLRGSFVPGAANGFADRTHATTNGLAYSSEFQYQVTLNAGAALYF